MLTVYIATTAITALLALCLLACLALHKVTKSRNDWRSIARVVTLDRDKTVQERDDAEREKRRLQEMCSEYSGQIGAVCEERDAYAAENRELRAKGKAVPKWN
ncbi:MAG TPA: hypothetical protein VGK73_06775 [Polyangiaceae bacterium]